jgi:hypothetical protein
MPPPKDYGFGGGHNLLLKKEHSLKVGILVRRNLPVFAHLSLIDKSQFMQIRCCIVYSIQNLV